MERVIYTPLQLREVFHLEFLRWFGRKVKPTYYSLKGGVNLRLFFNSFRYSEDMDLDIHIVKVEVLQDVVMELLKSTSFSCLLKPFGIEKIIPPDMIKAKQISTTQRFKIHLITPANEDLFTKIEFSRRGFEGIIVTQTVDNSILRLYKLPPLIVPHYDTESAVMQKIKALSMRAVVQARDIFDLYILSSQYKPLDKESIKDEEVNHVRELRSLTVLADGGIKPPLASIEDARRLKSAAFSNGVKFKTAYNNVFAVSFEQFRDTVVSYLSAEDQRLYANPSLWEEVKLKTADFIEEVHKKYA